MKSWLAGKVQRIGRRNLVFAALSVAVTSIVITGFLVENRWGYMKRAPLVIFMENWTTDRSAKDVEAERARLKAELALWKDATPEELQAGYVKFAAQRAKEATAKAQSALVDAKTPAPETDKADASVDKKVQAKAATARPAAGNGKS